VKNISDAELSTQEEMYHSLREILDKIGLEISDHISQLQELQSALVFSAMLNL
jgi:division protein CdvB (Snf7/Vps24/ESCRT-III family)